MAHTGPIQPDATIASAMFKQVAERSVDPTDDEGLVPILEPDGKLDQGFLRYAVYLPASEDIDELESVGVNEDSELARAFRVWAQATGEPADIVNPTYSINIGTNKYVVAFNKTISITNYIQAVVVTVDPVARSLTFGAVQTLYSESNYGVADRYHFASLGTDKFVYSRKQTADSLHAVVCTVSGTTITQGTATALASGTNISNIAVGRIADDKFAFISWRTSYSTLTHGYCTVSGTTITVVASSSAAITNLTTTSSSAGRRHNIIPIGTDKYVINNVQNGWAVVCTCVGASYVIGTAVSVLSANTPSPYTDSMVSLADDTFFWRAAGQMRYCTVSGTTISTPGAALSVAGETLGQYVINGSDLYELHKNTTPELSGIYTVTQSGGTITRTLVKQFDDHGANAVGADSAGANYFFIGTNGTGDARFHTKGMSNNFIGYLDADVLAGASARVNFAGIKDGLSGILPGEKYRAFDGGYIADPNGDIIGVSATSIFIK